jgi:hypothetical protein
MNWTEIRAAIETHLAAAWVDDDGNQRTPIQWENVPFDAEIDGVESIKGPESFIRATMIEMGCKRSELTGDSETGYSYTGMMVVQVFSQAGIGPAEVNGLMDLIDPIFREKVLNDCIYFNPEYNVVGKGTVGAWFLITMEFPFESSL